MSLDASAKNRFRKKFGLQLKALVGGFITRQDARIELVHDAASEATDVYVAYVEAHGDQCVEKTRRELLFAMHQRRTAYYRKVESEILNRGRLRGDRYEQWVQGWTTSSTKVLSGLLRYHALIRRERGKLKLDEGVFEPSEGNYRGLQAFFTIAAPAEAETMKEKFLLANLPILGFAHPYKPSAASPRSPMPFQLLALFVIILLITALVIAAHFVNPFLLAFITSAVIVLYVTVEIIGLRRDDKLKETNFVTLLKIILRKRFSGFFSRKGQDSDDDSDPNDAAK